MANALHMRSLFPANRLEIGITGHVAPEAILFEDVDDDQYAELVCACASVDDSSKSEIFVTKYEAPKCGKLSIEHSVVSLLFDDAINVRTGAKQLFALCNDGFCYVVGITSQVSVDKQISFSEKLVSGEVHTPTSEAKQPGALLRSDDANAKHNELVSLRVLHEMKIMMNARHAVCLDFDRDGSNEVLISFANVVPQVKVYRFSASSRNAAASANEQPTVAALNLCTIELAAPISSRLLVFNKHSVVFAFARSCEDNAASEYIRTGFLEAKQKASESRSPSELALRPQTRPEIALRTFDCVLTSENKPSQVDSERIRVEDTCSDSKGPIRRRTSEANEAAELALPSHNVEMAILRRHRRAQALADTQAADDESEFELLFAYAFGTTLLVANSAGKIEWQRNVTLPDVPVAPALANQERPGRVLSNLFCLSTLSLESVNRQANETQSFRLNLNNEGEEDFLCVSTWRGDTMLVDADGLFASRIHFPERCCAAQSGVFASPPNANTFMVRTLPRRARISSGKGDPDESLSSDPRLPVVVMNRPAIAFVTFDNRLVLQFALALPQRTVYSQSLMQRLQGGLKDTQLLEKVKVCLDSESAGEKSKLASSSLQKLITAMLYGRTSTPIA